MLYQVVSGRLLDRIWHTTQFRTNLLQSLKKMLGLKILAEGTPAGKLDDFLVDERSWKIEYAVADCGRHVAQRYRVIRYKLLGRVSPISQHVETSLSHEEFAALSVSGGVPTVSDEMERTMAEQFGSTDSRLGGGPKSSLYGVLDDGEFVRALSANGAKQSAAISSHFRRIVELSRYYVESEDGALYPVADFLADPATGDIRYLVLETPDWNPETNALLPPAWVLGVSWTRWRIQVRGRKADFKKLNRFDRRSHDDLNPN